MLLSWYEWLLFIGISMWISIHYFSLAVRFINARYDRDRVMDRHNMRLLISLLVVGGISHLITPWLIFISSGALTPDYWVKLDPRPVWAGLIVSTLIGIEGMYAFIVTTCVRSIRTRM